MDDNQAVRFAALFAGNTRVYGTYQNVGKERRADGKLYGDPRTVFGDPSALYGQHLEGTTALGIVPIRDDNTCVFGSIDIDVYADLDHAAIARRLRELDLPLIPFRSKSGGCHIYCFSTCPVSAAPMRRKLKEIAALLGHGKSEVFPKQTKLDPTKQGAGASWINIAYFAADEGTRYALDAAGERLMLAEFLDYAEARKAGPGFFTERTTAAESPAPESKEKEGDYPTEWRGVPAKQLVDEALHEALIDGEPWNNTGFKLSCALRDERYPYDEGLTFFKEGWFQKVHALDSGSGYDWKVALASFESAYKEPPRKPRNVPATSPGKGKSKGPSHATLLLKLIDDFEYLKSGPANDAYVRAVVGDHHEVWAVSTRSTKVRELLTHRFFAKHGMAPSREALNTVVDTILAQCSMGRKADVHVRFARSRDAVYLDLCDDRWRAVEVNKDGWRVVENPPVLFRRPNGALPLPVPTPGGSLTPLRSLVNCGDDSQWFLMVAWVVGAFLPEGAFSHLVLEGEQGSAKSTTARILQSLLDPSDAGLAGPPKDEVDATVSALHCGILAFDNLSGCRADISDVFCRFSTGQGYKTRTLYENLDLTLVSVKLPVLLNGIDSTVMRPDLLDRSITLKLPRILPQGRRTEHAIWNEFAALHPGCLGALLDAVSTGLRNLPTTTLADAPRMSDFCTWIAACEPALPWEPGEFIKAYGGKIREASMDLAENDALTAVIVEWAHTKKPESDLIHGYETTAGTFLNDLNTFMDGRPKDAKHWPMSPEALAHRLPRMAPLLRSYGIEVKRLPRNGVARSRWRISRELRPGEQAPLPKSVPLLAEFEKDAVQSDF